MKTKKTNREEQIKGEKKMTKKDLLKKIEESNCSVFWKVKAKNLNTKDLEKLVEAITNK